MGPEEQAADRYPRVPFEVPRGTPSVEVTLSYDDSRAVIDLGCEGAQSWRGWSGGARRRFVIGAEQATPGYVPGELEPGLWHVVLGLHKVPWPGVEVRLEISVPGRSPVPAEDPGRPTVRAPTAAGSGLPAPSGLRWYAGDFHAHTVHSDGSDSIGTLAARGVAAGLDFLAVTDHNTVSHHRHLAAASARHSIALLPGQEVTTARGHANAFGDIGWVDFREPADRWAKAVAGRGGVLSVNHPIEGDCAWQHPLATPPRALELWHHSWLRAPDSTAPWALWRRWFRDTVPLGGSDFHGVGRGADVGSPVTWVAAEECTPQAILDGVSAGRTAIGLGTDPSLPRLVRTLEDVVALNGASSVLVDEEGRRRCLASDRERIPLDWGRGLLRLEAPDRRLLAIC